MQLQKMSNLDYHFVVQELQEVVGGRLNKIYELSPGVLRFKFSSGANDYYLLAELGVRMHLTNYLEEAPKTPPSFAMFLRKRLENSRVVEVRQLNFDRIVAVRLQKEEDYWLVFEMFAKGNLLLCDANWSIMMPHRKEEKGGRVLAAKQKFEPPAQSKKSPLEISQEELNALNGKALDGLSKAVALPPVYLKEIFARAQVQESEEFSEMPNAKKQAVFNGIKKLVHAPAPIVCFEGETPTSFSSVEFSAAKGECKKFSSLSKALDEYYSKAIPLQEALLESKKPASDKARELDKLVKSVEMQKRALVGIEKEETELREKGDAIYANYQKVEELLAEARKKGEKKAMLEI